MLEKGTIIAGTMRNQDVLPAVLFALESQDQEKATRYNNELISLGFGYSQCGVCFDSESELWDLEADTLLEIADEIIDALQEYAPNGCYVGMNPGDGADLGVWDAEQF